ncbi:putative RNA-directed DNA polymerase [Helianthus anomalus]
MIKCSQDGTTTQKQPYNLPTTSTDPISPLPKSHQTASDPNWKQTMVDEYSALMENNTWELVPRPTNAHVIRCMWLYRHKFHANGTLQRYKARLVVSGKSHMLALIAMELLVRRSNLPLFALSIVYPCPTSGRFTN